MSEIEHASQVDQHQGEESKEEEPQLDVDNTNDPSGSIPAPSDEHTSSRLGIAVTKCRSTINKVLTYDANTFAFAARVSASMTLASILTLAFSPLHPYPSAIWVVTSVAIVSWQPHSDNASNYRAAIDRFCGNLAGAILALIVGSCVFTIQDIPTKALVLAPLYALGSFALPYASSRLGYHTNFNGARLSLMTFGVVSLAFYSEALSGKSPYMEGAWRAINVMIGCFIPVLVSLVWPISTKDMLTVKVKDQLQLAGSTADTVLSMAFTLFSNRQSAPRIDGYLRAGHIFPPDQAFAAYCRGIDAWKAFAAFAPNLNLDADFQALPDKDDFLADWAIRSHRAFRISNNIMMMDSVLRGGMEIDEYPENLQVLQSVGRHAKVILDLDVNESERQAGADELIQHDLVAVRYQIKRLRLELVQVPPNDDTLLADMQDDGDTHPLKQVNEREQLIFFFVLTEHLILRVERLHCYFMCHSGHQLASPQTGALEQAREVAPTTRC